MDTLRDFKEATISCIIDCVNLMSIDSLSLDLIVNRLESIILAAYELLDLEDSVLRNAIYILEEVILILDSNSHMLQGQVTITPRGRPSLSIDVIGIETLLAMNFKASKIAEIYGISRRTLHRRLLEHNISVRASYTEISDDQLGEIVLSILLDFPNTGYKRMIGFLLERGIKLTQLRVRTIMQQVDPNGVYQRTRQNRAIVRRVYYVRYSNQLWHLDTNLKLIRWKIVIRGALDGKSRTCLYLDAGDNNTAQSNLSSFLNGVRRYGIPYRCRSDKGGENVLVARYMLENRGLGRRSHICGRSVHNQRIERFWRDLGYGFIAFYRMVFIRLEDEGLLHVEDPIQMHIFHHIFIPRINKQLQTFMDAWNFHPLSTESNMTPQQIMLCNLPPPFYDILPSQDAEISADNVINNAEDLQLFDEEDSLVNPSPMCLVLSETQIRALNGINPLAESENYGCDLYFQAMNLLSRF